MCPDGRRMIGKTVMFSYIVSNAVAKGSKVLIITDRIELLTQAGGSLSKFGVSVSIINADSRPTSLNAQCYVSMAQTLTRRKEIHIYTKYLKEVDLVIIDEAHKATFDSFFEYFGVNTKVIGATATPVRVGNQKPLNDFYSNIVETCSISQLIEDGFLNPSKSYGVPVDLSSVKTKGNDYDDSSLSNFYDDNTLYTGAVNNYIKHANGTKALLFCSGVVNSQRICQEFKKKGIAAEHIDAASTSKQERKRILEDFEKGEIKVLCNVGILTTGYDCPSIETIILYRATKSLPLFLQMCGRGSRLSEGKKHFNILDFGNNISTHGFWEEDREWSLKKKRNKKTKGAAPIKECKNCEALVPAIAKECNYCGYVFPVKEVETKEVVLEELLFDVKKRHVDRVGYCKHLEAKAKKLDKNHHWIIRNLNDIHELMAWAKYKEYPKAGAWVTGVLDRRKNYRK